MSVQKNIIENVSFHHFGERCHPLLIINMLLNIKEKKLFQLGIFPFNTIIDILEEGQLEDIINIDYLRRNGNCINYETEDKHHGYAHVNSECQHIKYKNLQLVHDYAFEGNTIINKKFIENSHRIKMENFYKDIAENKFMIFITFLYDSKIDELKFEEMKNVLINKYKIQKFLIIIFSQEEKPNKFIPEEYEILTIENDYRDAIKRKKEYRIPLYRDIFEKFRNVMIKHDIHYKSFDELFDIKNMNVLPGIDD